MLGNDKAREAEGVLKGRSYFQIKTKELLRKCWKTKDEKYILQCSHCLLLL